MESCGSENRSIRHSLVVYQKVADYASPKSFSPKSFTHDRLILRKSYGLGVAGRFRLSAPAFSAFLRACFKKRPVTGNRAYNRSVSAVVVVGRVPSRGALVNFKTRS